VSNKTIKVKQCTVLWHVDNFIISHVNCNVVMQVIDLMKGAFEGIACLSISRGMVHRYLGMFIDYGLKEKVVITVYEFINDLLSKLPTDIDGSANTSVSSHLLNVNPESTTLVEKQSILFDQFSGKASVNDQISIQLWHF